MLPSIVIHRFLCRKTNDKIKKISNCFGMFIEAFPNNRSHIYNIYIIYIYIKKEAHI